MRICMPQMYVHYIRLTTKRIPIYRPRPIHNHWLLLIYFEINMCLFKLFHYKRHLSSPLQTQEK